MDFNQVQAEINRDIGIEMAINSANCHCIQWSDKALEILIKYLATHNDPFLTEDVRKWGEAMIPDPPSKRAWGGVIVKARNAGIIKFIGFRATTNVKAHRTPASLWQKS